MNESAIHKQNRNNRERGKHYERRIAKAVNGVRNLDKRFQLLDIYNDTTCYEVMSSESSVPQWILSATRQNELASKESGYEQGGIIKVWTRGTARAFLIKEINLKETE